MVAHHVKILFVGELHFEIFMMKFPVVPTG